VCESLNEGKEGNWSVVNVKTRSRDSSVSIVTALWARRPGFDSREEQRFILFATASRPALGLNQPPIQWRPAALSLGVKWPGREDGHSPPSSAKFKNGWGNTSTPIRLCTFTSNMKVSMLLLLIVYFIWAPGHCRNTCTSTVNRNDPVSWDNRLLSLFREPKRERERERADCSRGGLLLTLLHNVLVAWLTPSVN